MQKMVIKSAMFILTFFRTCCFFTSLTSICSSSLCSFSLEALLLLNESTTHHFCFVLFLLKEYSYDEEEKNRRRRIYHRQLITSYDDWLIEALKYKKHHTYMNYIKAAVNTKLRLSYNFNSQSNGLGMIISTYIIPSLLLSRWRRR